MTNPLLVTMRGPAGEVDISRLSNFEAGIAFLTLVDQLSPGIKWGELEDMAKNPETMGWSLFKGIKSLGSSIGEGFGAVKDGVGDVLKDTWTTVGDSIGSGLRLVTDEKVIDGASRLGMAYATGGGSEGVRGLFGGSGGSDIGQGFLDLIAGLGASFKSQGPATLNTGSVGSVPGGILPWALAGGAVLVLLVGRGGGRR